MMIRAEEARLLMPFEVSDEVYKELEETIKSGAALGCECIKTTHRLTDKAIADFKNYGYHVTAVTELEADEIDYYTISWG